MMHFDFKLGAQVRCKDEPCGGLTGLVVNPDSRQVTHLIVKEGFLFTRSSVLPLNAVQRTLGADIDISITSQEFDQYPEYRVVTYEAPAEGYEQPVVSGTAYGTGGTVVPMVKRKIREGIDVGQVVIEERMRISNLDGKIGQIEHVIVDRESHNITYLVVHRGLIFSERLMIPISMVEELHEDGITVEGTNEALERLSHYAPETSDRVAIE
jgi:uncharacterized protein YrrD